MEPPFENRCPDAGPETIRQIEAARALPVAVAAALMPDAHVGYGLPIGGVLAADNAVIPYAVGVDIACRMRLTVFDAPVHLLHGQADRLENALLRDTRFGLGARRDPPLDHPVMDRDWTFSPVARHFKERARGQLGTSGSGNHFAEFGVLTLSAPAVLWTRADGPGRHRGLPLPAGGHLALLTHSGSRGVGGEVAKHYSALAMKAHPDLPKDQARLAWLDLDSDAGREYWLAMELMGEYAAAHHELIHAAIARTLKADVLADVENHHNFAWRERHFGRDVVVHRKGATPAGAGALGIIPGSMATPGYVVRGRGHAGAMDSASHGAGRRMSRNEAKRSFTRHGMDRRLEERGVRVLSAGLDECPMAYKDIDAVMAAQTDLVDVLARFDPKIVRMADGRDRPED